MLKIQGKAGLPTAGTPAQPTYNPNIEQPTQQPVFMRPEDIMTNIQQTVPVSGAMESGVGAFVAPTPSENVGVNPTPENLTPEQIFQLQEGYNTTTESQFATPNVAPQFTNEAGTRSAGVLQQSLNELTSNIASEQNRLNKVNWDPTDAGNLIQFGNSISERFNTPGSAWEAQIGSTIELDEASKKTIEPVLTITGANIFSNINSRRYENTMAREEGVDDFYATETPQQDNVSKKDFILNPVEEVFEAGEPILNQMVSSASNDIIKLSSTPGVNPSREEVQGARDQAMTFIKDLTDQGQIKWARSKKGKVIPLIGDNVGLDTITSSKISLLYNPDSRGSVVTGLKAPKFPAMNESMLTDAVKKVFLDKRGKVKSTDAAESFIQLQGSIPIGVNPVLYSMQSKMYNDYQEKAEASVFNSTLSELSPSDFDALVKKHGEERATRIISQKEEQLKKEMKDIEERSKDRLPNYLINKQSAATLRYFHIANNLSIMGQKGTTRASFNFVGTAPIKIDNNSGLWGQGSPRVLESAKRIYKESKGKGVSRGQSIQQALYNLKERNPNEFQAINMYYNLGSQMAKHIDPASAKRFSEESLNNKPLAKWVPLDYISFGTTMLGKASILGKELIDANNNNTLSEFASRNSWMTEKGEWQYPSSVLIDAYQISVAPQGSHIKLQNIMESDARQSNAGLISIIVGDSNTASLLGLDPSQLDTNEEIEAGLRETIWSTVEDDVRSTFSGPDDGPYRAAFGNLLSALGEARGVRAAKDFARGLVVAGLYGKTSQKMYSEAEDFFDKINKISINNEVLSEAWNEMRGLYAGDNLRMLNDMTDLYTYSMEKHMSQLNGYQKAMRALGTAMAAINAPSTITNMLGGVQQLSAGNISPELEQSVNDQVVDGLNIKTDKIAGMNIPRFTVQTDYAGAADTRLEGDETTEYRPGTKQRNAWPVDVIQGGDSTIMTLAILAMNSPEGGFKGNPVQAVAIHDALITGPEGHLIAANAYNNIAIPAYAKQAPRFMSSVVKTYNERLSYIKDKYKDSGANIGTRFLGEETNSNSFHGLTGYFDKLYDQVYGANSEKNVDSPNLAAKDNMQTPFLESYQLARSKAKRDSTLKGNLRKKIVLEAAFKHGYYPPTQANIKKREFNKVNGKDFEALVDIMRASSGMLYRGESPPQTLFDIYKKLPSEYRPSKESFNSNFVQYGRGNTFSDSGLLERMTEQSARYNNVINSLVGATNEITHMVPA